MIISTAGTDIEEVLAIYGLIGSQKDMGTQYRRDGCSERSGRMIDVVAEPDSEGKRSPEETGVAKASYASIVSNPATMEDPRGKGNNIADILEEGIRMAMMEEPVFEGGNPTVSLNEDEYLRRVESIKYSVIGRLILQKGEQHPTNKELI